MENGCPVDNSISLMKNKLVPLLGIAFVVALISTGIFYGLFVGKLRTVSTGSASSVVLAAKPLQRGAIIQAGDVKISSVTPAEVPKGSFSSPEQTLGLTVLESIHENEAILGTRVASHKSIPNGMRGISVHVADSSGIVGMLQAGYRVDVQVVGVEGREGQVLKTVLQNVEVLSAAAPDNTRPVVNLLVTPGQADILGLADSAARIRLVLRNPSDDGTAAPSLIQNDTLFRQTSAPGKK
jgi:Flp pilus assembly protein CpaB